MLTLITAPDDIVTLDDAKPHLVVEHDFDDALIAGYINTATQRLDGRDGFLGRALGTQRWRMTLNRWSPSIVIPLPPCRSVEEIAYVPAGGGGITILDPADYKVSGIGGSDAARISPAYGKSWPNALTDDEAIAIEFTAGYGDAIDVPAPLRTAILMHVAHLYKHRESVTLGTGFITETPHGYQDAITDYRIWSF